MTQDRYVFHHADGRHLAFDLSQVERVSTRTPGPVDHRGEPTSRGVVLHWKNGARTEFGGELGEKLYRAYLPRMNGRTVVEESRPLPPGILKGKEARELLELVEAGPARPEDGPALRVAKVTREVPSGLDGSPSDSGRAIFLEADGRGGWVEGSKREFEVFNDFEFSRPLPVGLRIKVARTVHQWWLVGADWPDEVPAVEVPDEGGPVAGAGPVPAEWKAYCHGSDEAASKVLRASFAPVAEAPPPATNPLARLLERAGAELVHGLGRNRPFLLFADGAVDLADVQAVREVGGVVFVRLKGPEGRELKFRPRLSAGRKAGERSAPRDETPSREEASCRAR